MRIAVAGATGLIGSQLTRLARADGLEVVELSRRTGVDLTDSGALGDRLHGVDVVVDVTRAASEPVEFFTTVGANLGAAATASGVPRTIVLSIVGVDRSQDYPWYVATLAHESATREHAPHAQVLRSTQFHEFPEQILDRETRSGRAEIMDMPTQPVESVEVARALLDLATQRLGGDLLEIAGPRPERLVDLARQVVQLRGDDTDVVPVPAPASMAGGSILPGPDALLRGVNWSTWAHRHYRS